MPTCKNFVTWPRGNFLISLSLSLLIFKVRIMPHLQGFEINVKFLKEFNSSLGSCFILKVFILTFHLGDLGRFLLQASAFLSDNHTIIGILKSFIMVLALHLIDFSQSKDE